jgi:hypothetical protein
MACPQAKLSIGMYAISNVQYYWYDAPTGGNLLPSTPANEITVIKDNSNEQSWYLAIKYKGSGSFARYKISVFKSDNCGSVNPSGCAAVGQLLFREDFGGNQTSDPEIKPNGMSQVIGYTYNKALNSYGSYVIAKQNPNGHYPNGWYKMDDHTYPNNITRGYLLAFDANENPGQMYEYRIDGLCAGTKLYFSTWLVSLMKSNTGVDKVNLVFTIEDLNKNILDKYYTGDIKDQDSVWKNYGFVFTTSEEESSIILRIKNNGSGSKGNDFALDDIEIRLCVPPVDIKTKLSDTVCSGSSYTFESTYTDDGTFTSFGNKLA